jgi:hypothetical protein
MSSNETEPINSPEPRAITAAITRRLGEKTYAIRAPISARRRRALPTRTFHNVRSPYWVAVVEIGSLFIRAGDPAAEDDDERSLGEQPGDAHDNPDHECHFPDRTTCGVAIVSGGNPPHLALLTSRRSCV